MTVGEAIRASAERLDRVSDTPRLDAELLMAHALGTNRSDMLVRRMAERVPDGFDALIERRAMHEPIAYITGSAEFYGIELEVTPDVLIPRSDSEVLIEAARAAFGQGTAPGDILDLGTGSGALLIAAMTVWPGAAGIGIDASAAALAVARRNAERHGIGAARFLDRDWRRADWQDDLGTFDLVLCNPPYVEEGADLAKNVRDHEPSAALFAGRDGLDDYRILIPKLRSLLKHGALAAIEIGSSQAASVMGIAKTAGLSAELRHDLANRPRCLILS